MLLGCSPNKPGFSLGYIQLDGRLELRVYGGNGNKVVEACGVPQDGNKVLVPPECVVPADMPLDRSGPATSQTIPVVFKPIIGAGKTFELSTTIEVNDQFHLLEGVLAEVTRGHALPASAGAPPRARPGIAFLGYGGLRTLDATRLNEVDVVVRVNPVNRRDTGRTCAYTGMTGKLEAYDADLEAFDAHTGQSLGKTHMDNKNPGCPSTNYGRIGEQNTVTSTPSESGMNNWARSVLATR